MKKRACLTLLAGFVLLANSLNAQYLDPYGGSPAKHFDDGESGEFFRTKFDGEQWWLVTPDNNAFLSFGLNHFHSNLWAKDWNKTYWEGEFGGISWSDSWKDGFYKHARELTGLVEANSIGYHNEDSILLTSPKFLPYIRQYRPIEFSLHQNPTEEDFVDIFSDDFIQTCASAAKTMVEPYVDDPMIIGFAMSDIPVLTEEYAFSISNHQGYTLPTWPRVLRNLPATAPGKKSYVDCMIEEYSGKIAEFNSVYDSEFSSWEDLRSAENWRPGADKANARETADNNAFGKICINRYYEIASAAFRAVDGNHMFFGDKISANLKDPEELNLVVNEIKDYVDLIFIQCYGRSDYQEEIHASIAEVVNMPIINGDGGFGAYGDPKMPNPQYPRAADQAQRAEWMLEYAENAFKNPNFVGWHLCGVIDAWNTTGTQKPGIINPLGEKHTEVIETLATIGKKVYEYRGLPSLPDPAEKLLDWGAYENIKTEAIQRIELYRKGEEHLKILLPDGSLAADASVSMKLKRHDFKWGAVVSESFATSPYREKYRDIFLKYFNASGFGVALKPKFRGTSREDITYTVSMPWFLQNEVYVRGHTLAWEGINYLRPEDQAIYNDPTLSDQEKGDSLLRSCGKHFSHAIPKWDVRCWDVSNEPMTNNLINDLLPDYNTHVHWFKLADSIRLESGREDIVLYQNDYQVISAIAPWAMNRPARYREILDEQIALGAPIKGIGFQSRLKQGLITPDSIYKRLCDFNRYELPFQATEFEIRDDASKYVYTDQERRLLTEYMMVMYFSHPKVNGFWHWTFADKRSSENLDYPLFNFDGTPKVNGLIWMELMDGFFSTDISHSSDANGEVGVRGYYGTYELLAEVGEQTYFGSFKIDSTSTDSTLVVKLDGAYTMTGLEDSAAYELDQAIDIEISASSTYGDITSIGLFMEKDSIAGSMDSSLALTFTPTGAVEGWNKFTVSIYDETGKQFSHSIDVFFGDTLPDLEFLSQPDDPVYTGTTGNVFSLEVTETYAAIDSLIVSYAGKSIVYRDTSGIFFFNVDGLAAGDYQFIVRVLDTRGAGLSDTVAFRVAEFVNELPVVEIKAPEDSAIFEHGSEIAFTVKSSDSDGSIIRVEVFLNSRLILRFPDTLYTFVLDTLSVGSHEIIAVARDNRGDRARDTIQIFVDKNLSSPGRTIEGQALSIYPNPVSSTLYFSSPCDFEIYTILGRKILEEREALQLDVSAFKDGMYLVKANDEVFILRKE